MLHSTPYTYALCLTTCSEILLASADPLPMGQLQRSQHGLQYRQRDIQLEVDCSNFSAVVGAEWAVLVCSANTCFSYSKQYSCTALKANY
jgi:hypothetical protein